MQINFQPPGPDDREWLVTLEVDGPDPSVGIFGYSVGIVHVQWADTGEDVDEDLWTVYEKDIEDRGYERLNDPDDSFDDGPPDDYYDNSGSY